MRGDRCTFGLLGVLFTALTPLDRLFVDLQVVGEILLRDASVGAGSSDTGGVVTH